MTKEITKARVLQQLEDRFKLREFEAARFLFSETVIPTYDIARELQDRTVAYAERSVTAGPAAYKFFTVPPTQRWCLRGYNVIFMGAGAYTVTGVYIKRQPMAENIYLDMVQGQTVSYAANLPNVVVLGPLDEVHVYVDSYTSPQDLRLYIDYMVEEIR